MNSARGRFPLITTPLTSIRIRKQHERCSLIYNESCRQRYIRYFQFIVDRSYRTSETAIRKRFDPGEVEAIQLAKGIGADMLIIDDKAGRTAAATEGVKCMGILGVLVAAKGFGHLNAVAPILDELKTNRFYFSEAVKRQVLSLVDETKSDG